MSVGILHPQLEYSTCLPAGRPARRQAGLVIPAAMACFWIGTSGWHYSHWRGDFYPEDLSPRDWLPHYARHFPTVELNASFYRQPKTSTWALWRERTPQGFRFAVKASRFLTHIRRLKDPQEPLERVLSGARLLGYRLGPLLYQLPPGFHRTPDNAARLEAFLPLLPRDVLHAVEFRHTSWFVDETTDLLRRYAVAFVVASANSQHAEGDPDRWRGKLIDILKERELL